ncbi:MAG: flagellar hook protein FlgE [Rhodospirillum sp.]|nr:flagellar hook protein FlgE [Rhodospirillum sp.]MCF8491689.1 flagellar hook protein FlgE [Rhodospirillum sp.]MCF8501078.1 flagellar hook protein FlgE [Rhodospirillum sp.]
MSSLSSSMYIAVTALSAQSSNVSSISNNLANSETIGYKTTNASFYSLVTGTGSATSFTGAGVIADPSQNISEQGLIVGTNTTTDMAIDGDGFFVVTDSAGDDVYYYTRAGDFDTDADGNLVNSNGYYLQGYPTDTDGDVIDDLETVNLETINGTAIATTELAVEANLPADAELNATVSTDVEIYDSLGVAHSLTLSYEKTAENEWTMTASLSDEDIADGATISLSGTGVITFNEDGTLASDDIGSIQVADWGSGAADSTIAYDAGTAGTSSTLSQWGSSNGDAEIEVDTIDQDGVQYGSFYSATIAEDGLVYANFNNGISYPIYQVPLATFANADGLEAVSGNAYTSTVLSGTATLNNPNTADAGSINSGALESSTVDTADEFSNLIVAQQAYSAASEIISAAQEMFDDLISAKR